MEAAVEQSARGKGGGGSGAGGMWVAWTLTGQETGINYT